MSNNNISNKSSLISNLVNSKRNTPSMSSSGIITSKSTSSTGPSYIQQQPTLRQIQSQPNQNNMNSGLSSFNFQQQMNMMNTQFDSMISKQTQSFESVATKVTQAINIQTNTLNNSLRSIDSSIKEGFNNVIQGLNTLFRERLEAIQEEKDEAIKRESYTEYKEHFWMTLAEKKIGEFASMGMDFFEKFKSIKDFKDTALGYLMTKKSIAKFLGVEEYKEPSNSKKVVPFTKDIAESILSANKYLQEIKDLIYKQEIFNTTIYTTKKGPVGSIINVLTNIDFNVSSIGSLLQSSNDLMINQMANFSELSKYIKNFSSYTVQQAKNNTVDLINYISRISGNITNTMVSGTNATTNTLWDIAKAKKDKYGTVVKVGNKRIVQDQNEQINLEKQEAKIQNKVWKADDFKSEKERIKKYAGITPDKTYKIKGSKSHVDFKEITESLKKSIDTTNIKLEAANKKRDEVINGMSNMVSGMDVLRDGLGAIANPLNWKKIIFGFGGWFAKFYAPYKLISGLLSFGRDTASKWTMPEWMRSKEKPEATSTFGGWLGHIGGKIKEYLIDPLLNGISTIMHKVLGDEWFTKTADIFNGIKDYTKNIFVGLFGTNTSEVEAARTKLFEPIKKGVAWVTENILAPMFMKAFSFYMGVKGLRHPFQTVGNLLGGMGQMTGVHTSGFIRNLFTAGGWKNIGSEVLEAREYTKALRTEQANYIANNFKDMKIGNKTFIPDSATDVTVTNGVIKYSVPVGTEGNAPKGFVTGDNYKLLMANAANSPEVQAAMAGRYGSEEALRAAEKAAKKWEKLNPLSKGIRYLGMGFNRAFSAIQRFAGGALQAAGAAFSLYQAYQLGKMLWVWAEKIYNKWKNSDEGIGGFVKRWTMKGFSVLIESAKAGFQTLWKFGGEILSGVAEGLGEVIKDLGVSARRWFGEKTGLGDYGKISEFNKRGSNINIVDSRTIVPIDEKRQSLKTEYASVLKALNEGTAVSLSEDEKKNAIKKHPSASYFYTDVYETKIVKDSNGISKTVRQRKLDSKRNPVRELNQAKVNSYLQEQQRVYNKVIYDAIESFENTDYALKLIDEGRLAIDDKTKKDLIFLLQNAKDYNRAISLTKSLSNSLNSGYTADMVAQLDKKDVDTILRYRLKKSEITDEERNNFMSELTSYAAKIKENEDNIKEFNRNFTLKSTDLALIATNMGHSDFLQLSTGLEQGNYNKDHPIYKQLHEKMEEVKKDQELYLAYLSLDNEFRKIFDQKLDPKQSAELSNLLFTQMSKIAENQQKGHNMYSSAVLAKASASLGTNGDELLANMLKNKDYIRYNQIMAQAQKDVIKSWKLIEVKNDKNEPTDDNNKILPKDMPDYSLQSIGGSLGSLAQWVQSGKAKKWFGEQFNKLGDNIKAAWKFLKEADYKKMFGDAMAVFGGVTGNLMGAIFGNDKADQWLKASIKYAQGKGYTNIVKMLKSARSSLLSNVEDLVDFAEKNNYTLNEILTAIKEGGGDPSKIASSPDIAQQNIRSADIRREISGSRKDKMVEGFKIGERTKLRNLESLTSRNLIKEDGSIRNDLTDINDRTAVGFAFTGTSESSSTNTHEILSGFNKMGRVFHSRYGVYAVKLPSYLNQGILNKDLENAIKTQAKITSPISYSDVVTKHPNSIPILNRLLSSNLFGYNDAKNVYTKYYYAPYKDFKYPVDILLADHAFHVGHGHVGKGDGRLIRYALQRITGQMPGTNNEANLKELKKWTDMDPNGVAAIITNARIDDYTRYYQDDYTAGFVARASKQAKWLGQKRVGDTYHKKDAEITGYSWKPDANVMDTKIGENTYPKGYSMSNTAAKALSFFKDTTTLDSLSVKHGDLVKSLQSENATAKGLASQENIKNLEKLQSILSDNKIDDSEKAEIAGLLETLVDAYLRNADDMKKLGKSQLSVSMDKYLFDVYSMAQNSGVNMGSNLKQSVGRLKSSRGRAQK